MSVRYLGTALPWSMSAIQLHAPFWVALPVNRSGAITSTRRWRRSSSRPCSRPSWRCRWPRWINSPSDREKSTGNGNWRGNACDMRPTWRNAGSWQWTPRTDSSARSLEREWNEKLTEVERLERENLQRPNLSVRLVDPEERQRILALAQDLPKLWHAPTTTNVERKQLLGFLIKDVTLYADQTTIEISIRWQTEACTTLEVPRFRRMSGPAAYRSRRRRADPGAGGDQDRWSDRRRAESGRCSLGNQERVHHLDRAPAPRGVRDREWLPRPPSILHRRKAR